MPRPPFFSDVGSYDPLQPLIEGYQILYTEDALEPLTSATAASIWKPVFDPDDPRRLLGTVPFGTRLVTVALPDGGMDNKWLATRLIYNDCSVNGSRLIQPDCTTLPPDFPPIGSEVSSHCGPVHQ